MSERDARWMDRQAQPSEGGGMSDHWITDALERATAELRERYPNLDVPQDVSPLDDVVKVSAYLPVSDELLMEYGVIPDTRPPVHISWRTRLRWRLRAWRERLGRKVGSWIAGVDLSERDDD